MQIKTKIKLLISFIIATLYLFIDISFAEASTGLGLGSISDILVKVIDFLSWFWVIPAVLAGKLMSNDIVYGSALNLDVYLWQIWNMMKNFANFTLGFLFLFLILKTFFKGEPSSVIKDYLPKIVIAGVLIQATWFMMGAMVDLANIATAGVGSLSSHFFDAKNIGGEGQVTAKIPAECKIGRDVTDLDKISQVCGASEDGVHNIKLSSSALLPSHDDFSGPLLYFGYSVFQFHKFNLLGDKTDLGDVVVTVLIKAILILMFVVPIIVLFIANLLRVFWIWIWVMLSPFIVLDSIFGGPMSQKMEQFKVSNIIGLIFQPVAVIATLSLALIIAVQFEHILAAPEEKAAQYQCDNESGKGVCIDEFALSSDSEDSSVLSAGNSSFTMKGDIVANSQEKLGGGIGRIIEMIFLVFILRGLVKVGFKTSEVTSKLSDSIFNFAQGMAKSAPIIPTGQGGVGIGGLEKYAKRAKDTYIRSNYVNQGGEVADYLGEKFLGMEGDTLSEGSLMLGVENANTASGINRFRDNLKKADPGSFQESPKLAGEAFELLNKGGADFLHRKGVIEKSIADKIKNMSTDEEFISYLRNKRTDDVRKMLQFFHNLSHYDASTAANNASTLNSISTHQQLYTSKLGTKPSGE